MTNIEKYNQAFKEAFEVEEDIIPTLAYQSINAWDSVGHMGLIAALEETFDIMIETDHIIEFDSYVKGKEILKAYGVEF